MLLNIYINNLIFIGGLSEEVDEKILHAAFIPFGDIVSINIPPDYATKSRRRILYILIFLEFCRFVRISG